MVLLDASYVGLPLTVDVMGGLKVKWLYLSVWKLPAHGSGLRS